MGTKGLMFDLNEPPDDGWESRPSQSSRLTNNSGSGEVIPAQSIRSLQKSPQLVPGQRLSSCFRPFTRSTTANVCLDNARLVIPEGPTDYKSTPPNPQHTISVNVLPVDCTSVPFDPSKAVNNESVSINVHNNDVANTDDVAMEEGEVRSLEDFETEQADTYSKDANHRALRSTQDAEEKAEKDLQESSIERVMQDATGDQSIEQLPSIDNNKAAQNVGKRGRFDEKDAMLGKKRSRQTMFLDVREAARQAPPPKTSVTKRIQGSQFPFCSQRDFSKAPTTQCAIETKHSDTKGLTDGGTSSLESGHAQPEASDLGRQCQEPHRKTRCFSPDVDDSQGALKQDLEKDKSAHPIRYVVKQEQGKLLGNNIARHAFKKNQSLRRSASGSLYHASDTSIERLHREATCDKLWCTPGDSELQCVPGSFVSVQEYVRVFEPLLFEECRAQLHSTWEELSDGVSKDPHIEVVVKAIEKCERGWFDLVLFSNIKNTRLIFKEGDVAVISTPRPGSAGRMRRSNGSALGESVDGEVSSRTGGIIRRYVPVDVRDYHGACLRFYVGESGENQNTEDALKKKFQAKGVPWYLTVLGSLATTQREYVALHTFHNLNAQMLKAILNPKPELFPCYNEDPPFTPDCFTQPFVQHLHNKFNEPQLAAIKWAAMHTAAGSLYSSGVAKRLDSWPFTLVQGPPGTGKTHTVWGMLNVIHLVLYQKYYAALLRKLAPDSLKDNESSNSGAAKLSEMTGSIEDVLQKMDQNLARLLPKICSKPRMLVCAPSNAATDELLTRVLERGFIDGEMKVYRPDVARVGVDTQSKASQAVSVERRSEQLLGMPKDDIQVWIQQLRAKEAYHDQQIFSLQRELSMTAAAARSQGAVDVDPDVLVARDQTRDLKLQQLAAVVEEKYKVLVEKSRMCIVEGHHKKQYSQEDARSKLEVSFANEAEIVFTTLSSSGRKLFGHLTHGFDTVVIDEAAQASEVALLPPLSLGAARCVLVGDPQQLPATVISRAAHTLQYSRSLFERFQQAGCPSLLLFVQYRMHPQIRDFPSRYFYQGRLTDSQSVSSLPDDPYHCDPLLRPYVFYDISHGRESHKGSSVSYQNVTEAQFAANLYEHLLSVVKSLGLRKVSVGVITPYKLQLRCLQHEFSLIVGNDEDKKAVYINTVDAFQGQERDVIIMSCVRASGHGVGFVADIRRMNVALTRARRCLWVVGNAAALMQSEDWAALITDAKERGCFTSTNSPSVKGILAPSRASSYGSYGNATALLRASNRSATINKSGIHDSEDKPAHELEGQAVVDDSKSSGLLIERAKERAHLNKSSLQPDISSQVTRPNRSCI